MMKAFDKPYVLTKEDIYVREQGLPSIVQVALFSKHQMGRKVYRTRDGGIAKIVSYTPISDVHIHLTWDIIANELAKVHQEPSLPDDVEQSFMVEPGVMEKDVNTPEYIIMKFNKRGCLGGDTFTPNKIHKSKKLARAEMRRLAKMNKGVEFAILKLEEQASCS